MTRKFAPTVSKCCGWQRVLEVLAADEPYDGRFFFLGRSRRWSV